ncbi:MAG: hypothetical protein JST58_17630 [Bacteroidetes bacterium]|nr:hypothetical protein [Bacteroidota bacterium]
MCKKLDQLPLFNNPLELAAIDRKDCLIRCKKALIKASAIDYHPVESFEYLKKAKDILQQYPDLCELKKYQLARKVLSIADASAIKLERVLNDCVFSKNATHKDFILTTELIDLAIEDLKKYENQQ